MGSCSLIRAPLNLGAKLLWAGVGAGDRGVRYVPGGISPVLLEQRQAHMEIKTWNAQTNLFLLIDQGQDPSNMVSDLYPILERLCCQSLACDTQVTDSVISLLACLFESDLCPKKLISVTFLVDGANGKLISIRSVNVILDSTLVLWMSLRALPSNSKGER